VEYYLYYILGIVFLIACLLGVPLLKRILHERAIRRLGMDGVTVVPSFWSLSGLRFQRPGWKGIASFEADGIGGTSRGHLRFKAELTRPGKREIGPEQLARLDQLGGRVRAVGEGSVEIDGPLFTRPDDLKRFLELCDSLVGGTA
jgi:hypothetical protein